jgi:hypothetical protein
VVVQGCGVPTPLPQAPALEGVGAAACGMSGVARLASDNKTATASHALLGKATELPGESLYCSCYCWLQGNGACSCAEYTTPENLACPVCVLQPWVAREAVERPIVQCLRCHSKKKCAAGAHPVYGLLSPGGRALIMPCEPHLCMQPCSSHNPREPGMSCVRAAAVGGLSGC